MGAFSLIQQNPIGVVAYDSQVFTCTLSQNIQAGSALILANQNYGSIFWFGQNAGINSIQGGGVNWVASPATLNTWNTAAGSTEIWYGLASTGGAGTANITINYNYYPTGYTGFNLMEWTGVVSFDQGNSLVGTSATASTPTVTTGIRAGATEELVVACGTSANGFTGGNTGGFIDLYSPSGYGVFAYLDQLSPGSVSTGWPNNQPWGTSIAAFLPVTGAAPTQSNVSFHG